MSLLYERRLPTAVFRSYLGKPAEACLQVHQTHSARVVSSALPRLDAEEADGIVGDAAETLAMKTADCLPVALLGERRHALVHAGWRGLQGKILRAPELVALRPSYAFIGPCIRACCFEVTAEFADHFPQAPLLSRADGTLRFDLVAEARRQLLEAYPWIEVEESGLCTCCDKKFPSYRRDRTAQRIWNLLAPLAE